MPNYMSYRKDGSLAYAGPDIQAATSAHSAAPREPTEAMLNAARDWSYTKYGKPIGNDAAIGCWQAMFDAAVR